MNYLELSKNYYDMMVEVRRHLHKYPEVDNKLYKTSEFVEGYLKRLGIQYKHCKNNGIIAELGNKTSGRIVALRADMDALEVEDLKDVSYKSTIKGFMHACGHDAHTAILLGAAALLKDYEGSLNGRVRLIFQPAEETYGGAKEMIEYGALDGVSAIFGLHVNESYNVGTIGVKNGVVNAASNPFTIVINGKGSHGAYPEDGVDAIYISSKVIDNLQGIVSREISALDNAVITVGKINGGTAANAISSHVVMEGILRTMGDDMRSLCKERIDQVVKATAKVYRGNADVSFIESYPSFENDDQLYNWFINNISKISNIDLENVKRPSMGVEDFAYYTKVIPGLYYVLGCKNERRGINNPAHGSYFDIDEECMIYGCAVQTMCAMEYLNIL